MDKNRLEEIVDDSLPAAAGAGAGWLVGKYLEYMFFIPKAGLFCAMVGAAVSREVEKYVAAVVSPTARTT